MKIQKNFLHFKTHKNFLESKLSKIFQDQKNFLEPYVVNLYKNFLAGTEALNKLIGVRFFEEAQETKGSYEEGGIRIQENRPKSGGREETQTI